MARPTESSWDSDDELLKEDAAGVYAYPLEKDEELDEDALLASDEEIEQNEQAEEIVEEQYEIYEEPALEIMAEEDLLEDDSFAETSQGTTYQEAGGDAFQGESSSQTVTDHYPETSHVDTTFENVAVDSSYHEDSVVDDSGHNSQLDLNEEATELHESESESEDENDSKTRGRFKSERSSIVTITSSRSRSRTNIPDTLEITQEEEKKIIQFMDHRKGGNNQNRQNQNRYRPRQPMQGNRPRNFQQHKRPQGQFGMNRMNRLPFGNRMPQQNQRPDLRMQNSFGRGLANPAARFSFQANQLLRPQGQEQRLQHNVQPTIFDTPQPLMPHQQQPGPPMPRQPMRQPLGMHQQQQQHRQPQQLQMALQLRGGPGILDMPARPMMSQGQIRPNQMNAQRPHMQSPQPNHELTQAQRILINPHFCAAGPNLDRPPDVRTAWEPNNLTPRMSGQPQHHDGPTVPQHSRMATQRLNDQQLNFQPARSDPQWSSPQVYNSPLEQRMQGSMGQVPPHFSSSEGSRFSMPQHQSSPRPFNPQERPRFPLRNQEGAFPPSTLSSPPMIRDVRPFNQRLHGPRSFDDTPHQRMPHSQGQPIQTVVSNKRPLSSHPNPNVNSGQVNQPSQIMDKRRGIPGKHPQNLPQPTQTGQPPPKPNPQPKKLTKEQLEQAEKLRKRAARFSKPVPAVAKSATPKIKVQGVAPKTGKSPALPNTTKVITKVTMKRLSTEGTEATPAKILKKPEVQPSPSPAVKDDPAKECSTAAPATSDNGQIYDENQQKEMEKQRHLREQILKQKEQRRLQMASQRRAELQQRQAAAKGKNEGPQKTQPIPSTPQPVNLPHPMSAAARMPGAPPKPRAAVAPKQKQPQPIRQPAHVVTMGRPTPQGRPVTQVRPALQGVPAARPQMKPQPAGQGMATGQTRPQMNPPGQGTKYMVKKYLVKTKTGQKLIKKVRVPIDQVEGPGKVGNQGQGRGRGNPKVNHMAGNPGNQTVRKVQTPITRQVSLNKAVTRTVVANETPVTNEKQRRVVLSGGGDAPVADTVIIQGISMGTNVQSISNLTQKIGPIECCDIDQNGQKASVRFCNPEHAAVFAKKFNRSMLDLAMITVSLVVP